MLKQPRGVGCQKYVVGDSSTSFTFLLLNISLVTTKSKTSRWHTLFIIRAGCISTSGETITSFSKKKSQALVSSCNFFEERMLWSEQ